MRARSIASLEWTILAIIGTMEILTFFSGYLSENQLKQMMKTVLLSTRNANDFRSSISASYNSKISTDLNLEHLYVIPEMTAVDPCCIYPYQRRFHRFDFPVRFHF